MGVVQNRKWFFAVSFLLVVGSIVSLAIPPALQPGIDFTGGVALEVAFQGETSTDEVTEVLHGLGHTDAIIQSMGDNRFFIRLGELTRDQRDEEGQVTEPGEETEVRDALASIGGDMESLETVSGVVGAENVRNAIIAVLIASVAILAYVTWAFRKIPSPFRYGASAIFALVHDVVIILGLFSILGKTINLEVNSMFITGILLVIGYSVNDTIVVFDRLRENVLKYVGAPMNELVALSIRESLPRSLNTSITLLVVVAALILFAGESLRPLLYVAAAGVVVGTYSSIFTAGLTLVSWDNGELGKLFAWWPFRKRRPVAAPTR
ncbi:MAG: protein translocase subunit SecF [Dehalococcoidia bacterium]